MTPERLRYWCQRAHDYARRQGFYDGVDPMDPVFIASRLERIHSEISEAGDCVAKGEMAVDIEIDSWHYDPPKPVGFPIELADVFLRLADFAESQEYTLNPEARDVTVPNGLMNPFNPRHISACLNDLHDRVSAFSQGPYKCLNSVLAQLIELAESCGIDLDAMATVKMAYNETRTRMHNKVI